MTPEDHAIEDVDQSACILPMNVSAILGCRGNLSEGSFDTIAGGGGLRCAIAGQGICGEYATDPA
ncbi:MAG: hypothetical protein QNJ12_20075, partial [Ilumatobacter sp.]|uniref:hypothetical protein n=1 Tax=Ilumatobacter sp. TaxID=1967498 RepID=UPI002631D23E